MQQWWRFHDIQWTPFKTILLNLISFPHWHNNNLVPYCSYMISIYGVTFLHIQLQRFFCLRSWKILRCSEFISHSIHFCTKMLISHSLKYEIKALSSWKSPWSFPTCIKDIDRQHNIIWGNYCTYSQQRCHQSPGVHFMQCDAKWWKCHLLQIEAKKGFTNMV
jgi:hypothetical protein